MSYKVGVRNSKGEWPFFICVCGSKDDWEFIISNSLEKKGMAAFKCTKCGRTIGPFKEYHTMFNR